MKYKKILIIVLSILIIGIGFGVRNKIVIDKKMSVAETEIKNNNLKDKNLDKDLTKHILKDNNIETAYVINEKDTIKLKLIFKSNVNIDKMNETIDKYEKMVKHKYPDKKIDSSGNIK